ncbi:YbhB/YbcL family Raf kinase inhibitor-like protein [Phytoactinopolyspora halotolerans]|uniref:YbhB/YbcL family Raf kinase inhibitor-like protein n=1 Tax=Phytoactinopolyspora halotolerans TaxID=1981512 RepID=A0A6L9SD95_9ACTN|nr:YbhB/YbcL family Raf kinase inhibitor-like protein [Phytoactinopolyspora halotolerans]NEE03226.1 YbhB/YbcL family Raf kinase inhibitor-like protein [Phytoactinopolyspora halotolerans]
MAGIALRSPSFSDHTFIPGRHSWHDANEPPELEWEGVPDGAAELLLLCEDPDAPGQPFLHWLVTGLDPGVTRLPDGEHNGVEWRNGFGETGWGGPAPPVGDEAHRYFFRVFALSGSPGLPAEPAVADVHRAADGITVASGTLVGLFQR